MLLTCPARVGPPCSTRRFADSVKVFRGCEEEARTQIGEFCGNALPEPIRFEVKRDGPVKCMFVTFTSDNDTNGDGFVADYVIDDGLAEAVGARAMAEQIAELKASEKKKDNEIADLEASDQKKGKEITVIEEGIASLIKAVRENKALSTGATKAIEASQKHIAAHISDTAIRIQKNTHAAAAAQTGAAAAAATAESNLKRVQDNEIAVKANAKASAANKLKAEAQEKKRLVDAEEAEKKKQIAVAAKAA